jgi:hypothetical protein
MRWSHSPPLRSCVRREQKHPPTTQEIFDSYRVSRQETIATLDGIPLEGWCRAGRHAVFDTVTIRQQVNYFASHEITHLPQIERLRQQGGLVE